MNIKNLERLIELLEALPEDTQVVADPDASFDSPLTIQPITVSCEDATIVGYVITNEKVH